MKHYGRQTAPPVDGAAEAVQTLRMGGYRLGIVSSGTASRVLSEIEYAGLVGNFDVVICNEHTVQKKPHPEGLEIAIRGLSCADYECAYVGDSPEDIEMGRRAHVLTIGVKSSYPSSLRLRAANPDIYLGSLGELLVHFHCSDQNHSASGQISSGRAGSA